MSDANTATIRLHQMLYTQEAITEAAATFADFASFAVRGDGDYFVVDVTNINRDVEGDVVAEFCNFVLANSASQSNAASSPTE
jgi:hypothetical protein